jgi:CRP-like cAMP-binding protein
MSTHQQAHPLTLNRLLASLPREELTALHPHMEQVSLSHGQPIIKPDEPIPFVYFPVNSLLSLVTVMEDGSTVEAGSIGREGMAGLPILLDAARRLLKRLRKFPVKPCVSKPR